MSSKTESSLEEEECIICFYPLIDKNISILDCLHRFHSSCLDKWFEHPTSDKVCPLCRTGRYIITLPDTKKNRECKCVLL